MPPTAPPSLAGGVNATDHVVATTGGGPGWVATTAVGGSGTVITGMNEFEVPAGEIPVELVAVTAHV